MAHSGLHSIDAELPYGSVNNHVRTASVLGRNLLAIKEAFKEKNEGFLFVFIDQRLIGFRMTSFCRIRFSKKKKGYQSAKLELSPWYGCTFVASEPAGLVGACILGIQGASAFLFAMEAQSTVEK
mmetsp:Transcript_23108/g.31617  ORF Transcript_23108/g.31617 Transcript_23108/m.31617 type:complete len:125 (-) Transcript_23108:549-923(-)